MFLPSLQRVGAFAAGVGVSGVCYALNQRRTAPDRLLDAARSRNTERARRIIQWHSTGISDQTFQDGLVEAVRANDLRTALLFKEMTKRNYWNQKNAIGPEPINWDAMYWAAHHDNTDVVQSLLDRESMSLYTGKKFTVNSFQSNVDCKEEAAVWRKSLEPRAVNSQGHRVFHLLRESREQIYYDKKLNQWHLSRIHDAARSSNTVMLKVLIKERNYITPQEMVCHALKQERTDNENGNGGDHAHLSLALRSLASTIPAFRLSSTTLVPKSELLALAKAGRVDQLKSLLTELPENVLPLVEAHKQELFDQAIEFGQTAFSAKLEEMFGSQLHVSAKHFVHMMDR